MMGPMSARVLLVAPVVVSLLIVALFLRGAWSPGTDRGPSATASAPVVAPPPPPPPPPTTEQVTIRRGDNLVSALARHGVAREVGAEIAAALVAGRADLRRLRPTHTLTLTRDPAGRVLELTYAPGPWVTFRVEPEGTAWRATREETAPVTRLAPVRGTVSRSLFDAVEEAGESASLVVTLAEIFSSDFDFTADARTGDRFRLLVEKRYANERFAEYGRIQVAQYASGERVLTGVAWRAGRESAYGYYDLEGRSLRKSFLKSPLEFTRITSGFTYARPHPILGGVRPHLAIDYAAPTGTPVRAVAQGVVARAGWDGGNGISVRLHHRAGYETMYNHLSRLGAGVRAGARVSQRQVIGYVGATGLATGPHLDYRVARHGTFVNPLSEKFIPGEPIAARQRAEFLRRADELVAQLAREAPF
jgi:murein DD-endopeptidase MepM/ murein hydrolase activator NlpD